MKFSEMLVWTKIALGLIVLQVFLMIYAIIIESRYWWTNVIGLLITVGAFLWAVNSNKKINAYEERKKSHRSFGSEERRS